jgi:hypothetical protein
MKSKIIVGHSEVSGFFQINHGDIYRMGLDGPLAMVVSTGSGDWQLRHITPVGGPDYSIPPVEGWEKLYGHLGMIRRINEDFEMNN